MMQLIPGHGRRPAVVALVFVSLLFASSATAQSTTTTPRMVEVDGRSMRVMTAGFEHLERGQPVVVFESGAGTTLNNWGSVFTDVAAFAPAVAYDRVGIGGSEWDGQPPTPERVIARLHALLAEVGAPPPYVLVGHSWGGPLIRVFAGHHPGEVAGLVYVDPTDFTQSRTDEVAAYAEIGVLDVEAAEEAIEQAYTFYASQAPAAIAAEYAVIDSLMKVEPEERGLLTAPAVPVAVILGAKYQEPPPRPPGIEIPFEFRDFFEVMTRQRVRKMSAWALEAPEGLFVLATHAGHYVHQDDPALLVDAIRRVVFPDIPRQLRAALAEGGGAAMVETYRTLKRRYPPERFDQALLNTLGYELLREERTDDAVAVFEMNAEAFPDEPNPYDSLGDAYHAAGRLQDARRSYARAVELAEEKNDDRLPTYRRNLERVAEEIDSRR